MDCVKCGKMTNLVGSTYMGNTVKRNRQCPHCGHEQITYEIPKENLEDSLGYIREGVA